MSNSESSDSDGERQYLLVSTYLFRSGRYTQGIKCHKILLNAIRYDYSY